MATEDDNFDIDIYGDGGGYNANEQGGEDDIKHDDAELILDAPEQPQNGGPAHGDGAADTNAQQGHAQGTAPNGEHVTQSNPQQQAATETPAPPQGVKRKEHDDRPSDPDATPALLISDLYWWTTDDDIRGWVREADCEDELKDVTFSEHKVNGKSKGQAFIEFTTLQAATATKHKLESSSMTGRKYSVNYTNPQPNPFRTLPKDAPMRKDNQARSMSGGFNSPAQNMNFGMNNMGGGGGGGFRGGRGGFNSRGGMNNNMGGFNNRNFQNPMGFQNPMAGGFGGNPMGGMQNYGGFNNRGGMMGGMRGGPGGMRGGRGGGGMGGPNMMGMPNMNPMGGMGMNPMSGGMNPMMGGMGGNMAMQGKGGFQGPNPAFNQNFFPPNQGVGGDGSWNPHGAKRSRQE